VDEPNVASKDCICQQLDRYVQYDSNNVTTALLDTTSLGLMYLQTVPTPTEPIYRTIGREIARRRELLQLTQAELGEQISPSLTRAAISNIEAGRQRLLVHVMLEISRVLKVDPAELLRTRSTIPNVSKVEEELRRLSIGSREIARLTRLLTEPKED
jgi:transcriptional regulator with XRE-family HTH domain